MHKTTNAHDKQKLWRNVDISSLSAPYFGGPVPPVTPGSTDPESRIKTLGAVVHGSLPLLQNHTATVLRLGKKRRNGQFQWLQQRFDSSSTEIRPRHDHSTTYNRKWHVRFSISRRRVNKIGRT